VTTASGTVATTDIPELVAEGARSILWNDVVVHGDVTFGFAAPLNVFAVDLRGLGGPGSGTTLSASVDGGGFFDVFVGVSGTLGEIRFLGLIDDAASFGSVTLSNSVGNLVGLDPVRYGTATVVPEPGTGLLVMSGVAGLAARRRN
jgi:hypothetical protein